MQRSQMRRQERELVGGAEGHAVAGRNSHALQQSRPAPGYRVQVAVGIGSTLMRQSWTRHASLKRRLQGMEEMSGHGNQCTMRTTRQPPTSRRPRHVIDCTKPKKSVLM